MAESQVLVIKGAEVLAGDGSAARAADVLVENGVCRAVDAGFAVPEGAAVVEAAGMVLLPGLFDLNAHLREPGREDEEDFASASAAAIQGGVTGILAMPNTDPPIDSAGMVQSVMDLAAAKSAIPIHFAACLTKGRAGKEMAALGEIAALGVKVVTDDPSPVENPRMLRRLMEYAKPFGLTVSCHATTPALVEGGAMNEGAVGYRLGLPGMPAMAEEIAILRDLEIARHTGCPIHFQHISTRRGLAAVRRAKEEGLAVTCEVTPHHLIFDETAIGRYDTRFKMDPPLRTREDCEGLLEGLLDGTADFLTSDHAPHSDFEKQTDFSDAPFGVSALDTLLPALHHHLVLGGRLPWKILVERFSTAPRRFLGIEPARIAAGASFNAVLFDPAGQTVVTRAFLRSRGPNNPFLGETLAGRVAGVWLGARRLHGGA